MYCTKIFLAMIFNEIKCHVSTTSSLVGGASPEPPVSAPERSKHVNNVSGT